MSSILISDATIVNEGRRFNGHILIKDDTIDRIAEGKFDGKFDGRRIDASGKIVIPGVIDTHVHFRDPGLTHKGDIRSESIAAVAGGVTSVLEMPNTSPATVTLDDWEGKNISADGRSAVNYSFFIGATNDNLPIIQRIDPRKVCGVKLFMGSSTGGMLVDDTYSLSALFDQSPVIISAHCEQEQTIRENAARLKALYPDATAEIHPEVRSAEACYRSSARAVELADKYGARLNVAHLTTARELALFDARPIKDKKISAEACIAHLLFSSEDYRRLGNLMKCNPAVKSLSDRQALREALCSGKIDLVATDHAPHTLEEKMRPYWTAPSGMPMIQHSLSAMLSLAQQEIITLETAVEKMCHAPALRYDIEKRGFLRHGYKADITIIDPSKEYTVTPENILYKCGWSPLAGTRFTGCVSHTIVNGRIAYENGVPAAGFFGRMLNFTR